MLEDLSRAVLHSVVVVVVVALVDAGLDSSASLS